MKARSAPGSNPNRHKQSVIGVVFSEDRGRVLLIKRRDVPVWVLPGGGINADETPEQAIVREMKEETGYCVVPCRKIAEYTPKNFLTKCLTKFTHFYECRILSGTCALSNETQGVQFFPLDALPNTLPPPFSEWIEDATASFPHTLKKEIVGISYSRLIKTLVLRPILTLRFLCAKMGMPINDK